MIFFDTSYLARLYLDDHGYAEVRALAARHPLVAAIHGRIELVAALHRAYRERRYSEPVFRALIRQFQSDCAAGGIIWLPGCSLRHTKPLQPPATGPGPAQTPLPAATRTTQSPTGPSDATVPVAKPS